MKMLPAPHPVKLVRRLTSSIKACKAVVSQSQSASCVKGPANTFVNLIYIYSCVHFVKIRQYFLPLSIPFVAILTRTVREPAHNNSVIICQEMLDTTALKNRMCNV